MDLKWLSDSQLIADTKRVIKIETSATVGVVRRFREILFRELHLEQGYSSLFQMATDLFGYDNASAQRRINAMELMIAVPEVEQKLENRELCLQSAADIQTFLNLEAKLKRPYSDSQARNLVEACSKKSVLAVRRELAIRNPKLKFKESKRFIGGERIEIRYSISLALDAKHERLKQLWSHSNPSMTHEELIEKMTDLALKSSDPLLKQERAAKKFTAAEENKQLASEMRTVIFKDDKINDHGEIQIAVNFEAMAADSDVFAASAEAMAAEGEKLAAEGEKLAAEGEKLAAEGEKLAAGSMELSASDKAIAAGGEVESFPPKEVKVRTRYVATKQKRETLKRHDGLGCVFVSESTGKRCGSKYFNQLDHIHEWSRGGSNESDNLQVYCSAHNRWRWRTRKPSHVRSASKLYVGV